MQISNPIVTMIAKDTWCINEYGMDAMFVLAGDSKALLIDMGTGTFDVKKLAESLTDKPLMVVVTHGHVDHVGGAGYFDTIYLHEKDFEMTTNLTAQTRSSYVAMMNNMSGDLFNITPDDVYVWEKVPEMKSLHENDVIDLGGRKVVVYETPGHTPGGLSYLDVRERIIYTGDACNSNTLLSITPSATVKLLLHTAQKLKSLEPYYDRNYNGHIGYAADLTCTPLSSTINSDAVDVCTNLLNGSIQGEKGYFAFGGESYYARKGAFGVRYTLEQL